MAEAARRLPAGSRSRHTQNAQLTRPGGWEDGPGRGRAGSRGGTGGGTVAGASTWTPARDSWGPGQAGRPHGPAALRPQPCRRAPRPRSPHSPEAPLSSDFAPKLGITERMRRVLDPREVAAGETRGGERGPRRHAVRPGRAGRWPARGERRSGPETWGPGRRRPCRRTPLPSRSPHERPPARPARPPALSPGPPGVRASWRATSRGASQDRPPDLPGGALRAGLRGPASVAHGVNCGLLQAARVLFICLFALAYFNLIIKSQSATHPQARPPSDGADFSQVMIPINFFDG